MGISPPCRRHQELGAWSLELGAWSLELGAWSLELGAGNGEAGSKGDLCKI